METQTKSREVFAHSDPGYYRDRDFEDRSFGGVIGELKVAIIADGVGGNEAGERAAELTIESIIRQLRRSSSVIDIPNTLREAIEQANTDVYQEGVEEGRDRNSTVAVAVVHDNKLYVANVGDSRVYLIRGGEVLQVTVDHTWAYEAVKAKKADKERALKHSRAGELARAVGLNPKIRVDLGLYLHQGEFGNKGETEESAKKNQGLELKPGDFILVCSDGLIKSRRGNESLQYVSESEFLTHLESYSADQAVRALIGVAKGRKVDDNVSVAIIEIPPSPLAKFIRDVRRDPRKLAGVAAVGVTLLAFMCFGGYVGVIEPSLRPTATAPVPVGQARVENITGAVFFQESGQPSRQLTLGQTIKAGYGSYIQVENGKARFSLADGASVLVGPNTEVELAQLSDLNLKLPDTVLTLKRGVVVVNITVKPGTNFKIRTNLDVEAFVIGSIMGARYDPLTQLFDADCFEGRCRLLTQSLLGGQHSRTDSGRNPGSPDPVNYDGYVGLDLFDIGVRPTATTAPTATGTSIPTATRLPTFTSRPPVIITPIDVQATERSRQGTEQAVQAIQAVQTQQCRQNQSQGTPCP